MSRRVPTCRKFALVPRHPYGPITTIAGYRGRPIGYQLVTLVLTRCRGSCWPSNISHFAPAPPVFHLGFESRVTDHTFGTLQSLHGLFFCHSYVRVCVLLYCLTDTPSECPTTCLFFLCATHCARPIDAIIRTAHVFGACVAVFVCSVVNRPRRLFYGSPAVIFRCINDRRSPLSGLVRLGRLGVHVVTPVPPSSV